MADSATPPSSASARDEIQNLARRLAKMAPRQAEHWLLALYDLAHPIQLPKPMEGQSTSDAGPRAKVYREQCGKRRREMNHLAVLVQRELPDLPLKLVRINPDWRFDDLNTPWKDICAELRLILQPVGCWKLPKLYWERNFKVNAQHAYRAYSATRLHCLRSRQPR